MMSSDRPLLSRSVAVSSIRTAGQALVLTADEAERVALARHLGLVALDRLEAHLSLKRDGKRVHVTGSLEADVIQSCVVTLELLPVRVTEAVDLIFAEDIAPPDPMKADRLPDLAEIEVDLAADDPPEPIINGRLDPGPVLVEMLSLALDPYPRKPGVAFEMPEAGQELSPFAALARLKPKADG